MFSSPKVQIGLSNMTSIVTVIVVLALFGIIPPVADAQAVDSSIRYQLTPFNLFYLAYHGHFEQDGIDGGDQAGDVDPKMLVQVAIKHYWLPEQTLSNKAYLNGLNVVINGFNTD